MLERQTPIGPQIEDGRILDFLMPGALATVFKSRFAET